MRTPPKLKTHEALVLVEEVARIKCETCDNVTYRDGERYCLHCKLYWEDVGNGLFNDPLFN